MCAREDTCLRVRVRVRVRVCVRARVFTCGSAFSTFHAAFPSGDNPTSRSDRAHLHNLPVTEFRHGGAFRSIPGPACFACTVNESGFDRMPLSVAFWGIALHDVHVYDREQQKAWQHSTHTPEAK